MIEIKISFKPENPIFGSKPLLSVPFGIKAFCSCVIFVAYGDDKYSKTSSGLRLFAHVEAGR